MSDTKTLVRGTDPETSHIAAERVLPRRETVRAVVHRVLEQHGPLTHDELIARYRERASDPATGTPLASDSSIRTRCAELVDQGLVEAVENRRSESAMGNPARLWRVRPRHA